VEGNFLNQQTIELVPEEVETTEAESIFCSVCPLKRENLELRCERGYWQEQHRRAVRREERLKEQAEQLRARIKYLEKQLYGRKSEKGEKGPESQEQNGSGQQAKRRRGQQVGVAGHTRRLYDHLPVVEEVYELGAQEKYCPRCGLPVQEFPGTEDSEELEIEVRAYRRRIRRKRYKPGCACGKLPGILTAKGPSKLIPKSRLGISVWVMILLEKYLYQRPTARLLESLKSYGVDIAPGTVGDGLKRLLALFEPVQRAICQKSRQESWWHADETSWRVFELPEGKLSHRWYLWVFVSESAVVYILDPRRSCAVIQQHLGGVEEGILCVDRYAVYKSFAKNKTGIILAFCWTHQRRDFLKLECSWPQLKGWSQQWVQHIGAVFHLNHQRLSYQRGSAGFAQADQALREAIAAMQRKRERELRQPRMDGECVAVLKSLKSHWEGLKVFLDHPHIPMDNSEAERRMRGPALGRKNYYGSGSIWSAQLTSSLFSIFQTLLKWNINPRIWLLEYLSACAQAGGVPPKGASAFLPWKMSARQRKRMELKRIRDGPSSA
jgi:transposase